MTEEPTLLTEETRAVLDWHDETLAAHNDRFEAAKDLVERLGAHWHEDHAVFGFWTPELLDEVPADAVSLELLTPTEDLDPGDPPETATFERSLVETRRNGEFTWAAVAGGHLRPGTRETFGSCYQLVYDHEGERETVTDPVAYSLPFGAFAPPELYDMNRLDAERDDREYFGAFGTDDERVATSEDDGLPRVDPATSMLEIHPGTASEAGSLAGLAREYAAIGERQRDGEALTPAQENFAGYDAIQLMPVEPITEHESHPGYWRPTERTDGECVVELEHPDMRNWGYDIVVSGFSAVNPAILETGRPDELVDFIATCHSLPRPIKVVFDVALGHADNGGLDLLNDYYFSGPGMYGQDLDYTQPVVRAVLLELQRRKMDFGADGIRVDGAQDFTNWDPERGEWHDDAFLAEMDAITQEVAGREYRPWMIFEDGRPWPREDWELASTYRALIEQHPHSFQWSPITFAHNTPALLTFWATKWWRVYEVADFGSQWITGVANHDTVRRGTQIDPTVEFNQSPVNPYLGETLPDTLDEAYDNPAANMLMHCFIPGVPMDFLNANMRTPWGFVRDTDEPWNVKVVADEHNFVDWQLREGDFEDERFFHRLKELGFETTTQVETFIRALADVVDATDYDLETMAAMLAAMDTPLEEPDPDALRAFGLAWMRDVHDFATVTHWTDAQDPDRTAFDLAVREFRHERPWLRDDLSDGETFTYQHPTEGTVLYYGHRVAPDGDEELLFVANMEGVPVEVTPTDLVDVSTDGWSVEIASASAEAGDADEDVRLPNAAAVVFSRSA